MKLAFGEDSAVIAPGNPIVPSPLGPSLSWLRPSAIRGVWLVISLSLMIVIVINPWGLTPEGLLVPFLVLLFVTSPLSWLSLGLMGLLVASNDQEVGTQSRLDLRLIAECGVSIAVGYWQWFVLVPFLLHRWRRRASAER